MKKRLIQVKDTVSGVETTILIERTTFPDSDRIVWPRESEHIVFHQIGGTYDTVEDFNREWEADVEKVEHTVLCSKCREPVTYLTPNLDDLVNFTCMEYDSARRFSDALIDLLRDGGN